MRITAGEPPWALEFEPEETWMLGVLLDVYESLVSGEQGPVDRPLDPSDPAGLLGAVQPNHPSDPFSFWEADLDERPGEEPQDDPALRRLFPDAYPDDQDASDEFRRFTAAGQRRERLDQILDVRVDLDVLSTKPLMMQPERVEYWLRTINAIRLVLATRLGIVDELSADRAEQSAGDDPSDVIYPAYEWLGVLIEMLVEVSWE
ncbi:DUF2017 family protein [Acidipropionibacterium acidipropionici]|jgi:hypothetical protein|uniref:DUF2017 family protein n=1 Tax=Acidipropionibacterium acidipropionici TaxID=1748 RepID=UPI0004106842|nr:DUF2017 family protein [Acidipropionibacterium acidipropionici]ALN15558.1 hypothetical protein ASQ49_10050 [Acidipropionibacterium acidipropionici]APZ08695.1 hypothetical protein BWX38_04855 [Acidipropionibacterium acidipropionici]